jgi:hypothetical protein
MPQLMPISGVESTSRAVMKTCSHSSRVRGRVRRKRDIRHQCDCVSEPGMACMQHGSAAVAMPSFLAQTTEMEYS